MNADEDSDTVAIQRNQPSARAVRVGFWLSWISLTLGVTLLSALPTSKQSFAQTILWVLCGAASSVAAFVLSAMGRGRRLLRLSGFLVSGLSLVVWILALWFSAIAASESLR